MDIKMSNSFLQKLVDASKKIIDKIVNDQLPKLSKSIDDKIKELNAMVAGEGPSTFVFPVYGNEIGLNMTMTTAPITKVDSNLIKM